jgi:predicted nucleotidyltransferase component of viral defense system
VLRGYDEFDDLPQDRTIRTYSLGEIASEKLIALGDRARNEPRDLYDLWYLTDQKAVDLESLLPAISEKLAFRNRQATRLQETILKKEARLKALWLPRLGGQMVALPPFETVFRESRRTMRQAELP